MNDEAKAQLVSVKMKSIDRQAKDLERLTGTTKEAAIFPFIQRAVEATQPKARQMIINKLRASGVKTIHGDLLNALNKVRLVVNFRDAKGVVMKLIIPKGLPESMYRRIWSLDRGFDTGSGQSKARHIFTLNAGEKQILANQVLTLALGYMRS